MHILKKISLTTLAVISLPVYANNLPENFVYLSDIDPNIVQEIRYAGYYNFIGRPVKGYDSGECILTRQTAEALSHVQADLKKSGFSLKVYDCYRPQKAVDDFIAWSKQPKHQEMKAAFYPNTNKADFFKLGYVAEKSGHTRGSTVDVTINQLDMGTNYDYMDELSHSNNQEITNTAYKNRQLLYWVMEKYGFVNLPTEWWHFTLKDEPYAHAYFNFNVQARLPKSLAIPRNSRQLLVVRAKDANTFKADMQRYERNSNKETWHAIGDLVPVVLGKNGLAAPVKKEGDLRTPVGVFKIGSAFGFEEKEKNIKVPYQILKEMTVCVDDSTSHYYNQIVSQATVSNPDWYSAEKMRQVPFYKIGAVISYNDKRTPGAGSCIFMHIWKSRNQGTAGCIAMAEPALKETLAWFEPEKQPVIAILAR